MRIRQQPPAQLDARTRVLVTSAIPARSSDTLTITAVSSERRVPAADDLEQGKDNEAGRDGLATGRCSDNNIPTISSASASAFSSFSSSKKGGTGNDVHWLNRLRAAKGFLASTGEESEPRMECFPGLSQSGKEEEEAEKEEIEEVQEEQGEHRDADDGRNGVMIDRNAAQQHFWSSNPSAAVDSEAVRCNAADQTIDSENIRWSFKEDRNDLPECSSKVYSSDHPGVSGKVDASENESTAAMQFYSAMFTELFCMESSTSSSKGQFHRKEPHPRSDCRRHHRKQENPKIFSANGLVEYEDIGWINRDAWHTIQNKEMRDIDISYDMSLHQNALVYQLGRVMHSKPSNQKHPWDDDQCKDANAGDGDDIDNNDNDGDGDGDDDYDDGVDHDNAECDSSLGNEIFVIDTSLRGWNVEKLIVRNGNSWSIQDKRQTHGNNNPDCSMTVQRKRSQKMKRKNKTFFTNPKNLHKAQMQWVFDNSLCKELEQQDKDDGECKMTNKSWSATLQTQIRSQRKRRSNAVVEDMVSEKIWENIATNSRSSEDNRKSSLASDHPANLPKEGLSHSIYQVFMQAGKTGLTAREAVSKILEQGLPGLHEGGVVPRVEVLKVVSNSPYFMPLEESKYILCSALVEDDEQHTSSIQEQSVSESGQNGKATPTDSSLNLKAAKRNGLSQYWAAIRRARTGKSSWKPSCISRYIPANQTETVDAQHRSNGLSQTKRLKFMKQDATGLGNRCNRTDGKGWHCPLRAKIGYLLCDHHLGRLRSRVKSQITPKMFSTNRSSKDERKRILSGSWVVKKVVERSRIGRQSHVANFLTALPSTDVDTNGEHGTSRA